jgi:GntR family transcriptional repressor for pyruvate dehydrogenase complex
MTADKEITMKENLGTKSLADEVYEALLEKIMNKEWAVGEKLPSENQICKEYGVSRVSARSAIQRLQAQNLVVTKPGRGSFIAASHIGENMLTLSLEKMDLSKDEYRYVVELRKALEFTSVELMCERGTDEDFDRLHRALEAMYESGSDAEQYVEADFAFHMALIKGSHNPLFISVIRGCKNEFLKYFTEMAEVSNGNFEQALKNHTAIYEAMKTRKPEKVKKIIEGTFEYNLSRFKNMFKEDAL